ncbi:MAG: N-acetylmuramoyl-L-alanine amidase [Lachnospiraceae bacterium]|nr:N-acetylmuramoyl-L-alanine amidase [Lachnospiraceae bacterium]
MKVNVNENLIQSRLNKETVIVIDPGHGGENKGADYSGLVEKSINMKTANAMYEELSKYENVKVYLSHTDIEFDMSLKERAEYAKSVNADYLISLHYNASEDHSLYGCEAWIPSIGSYYVKGYQLADNIINEITGLGINSKGVKTRIGDDGDEYYGIIRECENRGITSIIVEHCYLDNRNDSRYVKNDAGFENFGKADALGLAKFLGLKSNVLGVDYSTHQNVSVIEPQTRIYQDSTPPEIMSVEVTKFDKDKAVLEFSIQAKDNDTYINYYSYSLDGGKNFTELLLWDTYAGETLNIGVGNISEDIINNGIELVVRVYNMYDVRAESEMIDVYKLYGIENESQPMKEETSTENFSNDESSNDEVSNNSDGENETKEFIEEESFEEIYEETFKEINTETSASKDVEGGNKDSVIYKGSVIIIIGIILAVILAVIFKKGKTTK